MTGKRDAILQVRKLVTVLGRAQPLIGKRSAGVCAVDSVDLDIAPGEILGLVGESGCGKSTLARTLLGVQRESEGDILLDGRAVGGLEPAEARRVRSDIQYVYQDPGAALDPWWSIGRSLEEGLTIRGNRSPADRQERVRRALSEVGLDPATAGRYPHELSGGQRQRVNIARALALGPRLVLLDEAVSALDKSVEAQVLNLLLDLKDELDLTYLFISHDLNVVQFLSERVAVMYLGRVVEIGPVEAIYERPAHPYTMALLAAMPAMDPDRRATEPPLQGDPPNPINPPSGCRFRTRCAFAEAVCAAVEPPLAEADHRSGAVPHADAADRDGHYAACLMILPGSGHSRAPDRVKEVA